MTVEAAIHPINLGADRTAAGVRAGDPEAWRVLYEELGERVFRLLYRLTRDRDAALDLTQDTFLTIAEKGHRFVGRGSLQAWVFRIAGNLARESFRRTRVRERHADAVRATPAVRVARDTELTLVLDDAVGELSDKLRTVLLLHDVDGYTHAEIAEMVGITEGGSKARLSRARAHLRARLERAL